MRLGHVFAPLATAAVLATGALAQFIVNTPPNAVVCQPALVTWAGGEAPYFLAVVPGGNPSGPALADLGVVSGRQFTWIVNIAAGTSVGLSLRDSSGQVAQSAPFTIKNGPDTSCVHN